MQFNLSQLLREPLGATREYDIDEDVAIDGETHRLIGSIEVIRTDRGTLVHAEMTGAIHSECSRCLAPIGGQAHFGFEEEYIQTVDAVTGAPLRIRPEADDFTIDARHTIDLDEAVRQYWVLAQPMQPLCRPDCAGLCPQCGRNRNEETCDCQPADHESAELEKLRGLLGR